MPTPLLILVSGPPGSGKTTLARKLAQDLHLPLLCRDDLKESLFESLGVRDRDWSRELGKASWHQLYTLTALQLGNRCSLIIESNFQPAHDREKLMEIKEGLSCTIVEVHCTASPDILLQRFRDRATSGERHPGHMDHADVPDFEHDLRSHAFAPMHLGEVITVDTTDFLAVPYDDIRARIANTFPGHY